MATAAQAQSRRLIRPLLTVVLLLLAAATARAQAPSANSDTYLVGKPPQGEVTPAPLRVAAYVGVLGNDTDPTQDTLTAVLVSGPSNGTLTLNADGSFVYTPGLGFVPGGDSFTYGPTTRLRRR